MRKEGENKGSVNQENGPEGKVVVSVHLTESQKVKLEEITGDWGIDMAQIGRRLIRHLLDNKVTLLGLLQKYQAVVAGKKTVYRPIESRNYRICIRLLHEEKQRLSTLADEWFYLPGELARILFELFIIGIIGKNDIWE